MSKIFGPLLLVIILAAAGLFYAAPIISFHDVRSACKSQDIEALAKLIDFDSVRASLRLQLLAGDEGIAAPAPSALNDPVGATGSAFKGVAESVGKAFNELVNPNAPKTPKPVIDVNTYLTPKALLGLTYGAAKDANKFELSKFEGKPPAPKTAFFSLERARLTVTDETHGATTFTFERRGLTHWRLVHIGLPTPDMEPKPETPAG